MSGPEWTRKDSSMGEDSPKPEALASEAREGNAVELEPVELTGPELASLEADLRSVLRPLEVPVGFVDRVLVATSGDVASVSSRGRARVLPFRSWRWMGGAIAASLLAGSFVAEEAHQRRERERAAAIATQQFETAARITDETLQRTRDQLRRAGVPAIE